MKETKEESFIRDLRRNQWPHRIAILFFGIIAVTVAFTIYPPYRSFNESSMSSDSIREMLPPDTAMEELPVVLNRIYRRAKIDAEVGATRMMFNMFVGVMIGVLFGALFERREHRVLLSLWDRVQHLEKILEEKDDRKKVTGADEGRKGGPNSFPAEMNREFRVSDRKWPLLSILVSSLWPIPVIIFVAEGIPEDSGIGHELIIGLVVLAAMMGLFSSFRRMRTHHFVRVDGDVVTLRSARGKRKWPAETVTTITDDQIQFHLYTKETSLSISKKRIPDELAEFFDWKIEKEDTNG